MSYVSHLHRNVSQIVLAWRSSLSERLLAILQALWSKKDILDYNACVCLDGIHCPT